MNVKRFTARNSREAMALVRQAFGDDAVVLSNKPCPEGVEVLAMAPEGMSQIERVAAQAPRAAAARGLRSDHAAERHLFVFHAGAEDAQVGHQLALALDGAPAEQVVRHRVESVDVGIEAGLFEDEDVLPLGQDFVQVGGSEVVEMGELPVDHGLNGGLRMPLQAAVSKPSRTFTRWVPLCVPPRPSPSFAASPVICCCRAGSIAAVSG